MIQTIAFDIQIDSEWMQWTPPTKPILSARLPPGIGEVQELNCYGQLGLEMSLTNPVADRNELRKILFEYLRYPSSDLAHLHAECNRLGLADVIEKQGDPLGGISQATNIRVCTCCGFKRQQDTIPLSLSLNNVSGLGSSTILLFEAMRNCILMLLIAGLVYSFYAVRTSMELAPDTCPRLLDCTVMAVSLHPKTLGSSSFYQTQSWLGAIMVILWGLWFLVMNYRQRKLQVWTDRITISASDFTIMIEGLSADINQDVFQTILNHYRDDIDPNKQLEPLEIVRFNIAQPYYLEEEQIRDEQLQSLKRQRSHLQSILRGWLRDRRSIDSTNFQQPQTERQQLYRRFDELNDQIKDRVHQMARKIKERYLTNKMQMPTNTVFVTFRYSSVQHLIVSNNQSQLERLRAYLLCRGFGKMRLPLTGITVQRAPEPEDIIFANVGVPASKVFARRLTTYFAALMIVIVTFLLVFLLKQTRLRQRSNRTFSILISVGITIINFYLAVIIRKLTAYEKNPTRIYNQRSQAIKVIVSQIANMAVLPFLQNAIIENNIFSKGGLTEAVFYLAVTNALLTPLLKLFDYRTLLRLLRRWYHDKPERKLHSNQKALNQLFDGKNFQVGTQYIYTVKTMVFTSFYLSLQPSIALISMFGIVLMYWASKYILLKRSQRPPPGTDIVHHTLCQFVYLCPLLFCLGGLTWPYFIDQKLETYPYLLGVAISIVLYLLPLEEIFTSLVKTTHDNLVYEQQRIRFSAQYDRRNPATKKRAEIEYRKYLDEYQRKLANDSSRTEAEKRSMFRLIERDRNQVNNHLKDSSSGNSFYTPSDNDFETLLLTMNNDQTSGYVSESPLKQSEPQTSFSSASDLKKTPSSSDQQYPNYFGYTPQKKLY